MSVAQPRAHRLSASKRSRRTQERAENRHLRQVVEHYRGCLGSLDARSQRLLSLRAGLHGAPRSARAVARILQISSGREQLLEQISLLTLQSTGGGCASSPMPASAPATGAALLTATAPWIAQGSAVPVSDSATVQPASSSSSSNGSRAHVRSGGGRSADPLVITPSATRTVEQAATGQGSVSWIEIALFASLAMAVSLVLLPGVRRRLLPLLAGAPSADGHAGPTGNVMIPNAEEPPAAAAIAAAQAAPAAAASAAAQEPPAAAVSAAAQAAPAAAAIGPQTHAETEQAPTAAAWVRRHATAGVIVATVIAGWLVRMFKRSRVR